MSETLLIGAFLAALSYVLIPGPAFLALLGIGAGQGRKAGALFMGGHLAGDVLWSTLALVAIVGARSVGTTISISSVSSAAPISAGSAGRHCAHAPPARTARS